MDSEKLLCMLYSGSFTLSCTEWTLSPYSTTNRRKYTFKQLKPKKRITYKYSKGIIMTEMCMEAMGDGVKQYPLTKLTIYFSLEL